MAEQLLLGIDLQDHATFNNFVAGENTWVINSLQQSVQGEGERYTFLWGEPGVGCSHLLQACCHQASSQNCAAVFLDLSECQTMTPALLEGLEQLSLVCLDNIQAIVGNAVWEEALFHLYNRIREQQTRLIIAAQKPPAELALGLADLKSRLSAGMVYHVQPLSDDGKLEALQLRAKQRGFDLPTDVGHFLLRRCSRQSHALFALLEQLGCASLTEQRRLTIPFVKQALNI